VNKQNDDLLVSKFPNVFRKRSCSTRESCMGRGFSCSDGWFKIIYDFAEKAEAELLKMNHRDRFESACEQVKEKFGTLRIYMTRNKNENIDAAIAEAYEKSEVTCEECGKPGKVRGGSWIQTLCATCAIDKNLDTIKNLANSSEPDANEKLKSYLLYSLLKKPPLFGDVDEEY